MRLLESKSYDTEIWYIKEETKMTIEKILEIKNELVNQGIINETIIIDDSKFLKLFEELKEWFKWDIQRFPYKELIDPIGYHYNYKDCDLKFYNENYDLIVFSAIVGIYICTITGNGCLKTSRVNHKMSELFSVYCNTTEMEFYRNYKKICSINKNVDNLAYFVKGMIRNKMGNGTFEEFLDSYTTILQKYKTVPLIDKDGTIETTATPVVEPKYIPSSDGFMEQVKAKYSYVPAAYLALQCNPVGLWYMYQQTGKYRSQFVDYNELDKSSDNMALNHIEAITKLMTKCTVYQMILQEMPEIGTDINGKTIKLKIAGYNASKVGLLAVKDDEHVLAIIYDMASDNAHVR